MAIDYTLYGQIKTIVLEETRFMRHYQGQVIVNVDPLMQGRVQALCPELGWDTPINAPFCAPRQMHSMSVPNIGEYIEIYFMAGDVNRPVYLGLDGSVMASKPATFDGLPTTHVMFADPVLGHGITFNQLMDQLDLTGTLINIGGADASEAMVLGTAFLTWLSTFITSVFNAHMHPTAGTGPPSPPAVPAVPPAPTEFLSLFTKVK